MKSMNPVSYQKNIPIKIVIILFIIIMGQIIIIMEEIKIIQKSQMLLEEIQYG